MTPDGDPRLTDEHVRELPGGSGHDEVVLVGVVHDHPASTHRAMAVIEALDPDVLALELPPVAVPLFERYAESGRTPPAFGGEMSAAVQVATTDEVVGIDGPTAGFVARLARALYRDGASIGTLRSVLRGLGSVTRHAVLCRFAAVVAGRTDLRVEIDSPVVHDCRWSDDPRTQAADERDQVRQARAVTNVFGRPDAVRVRETAREAHMADRLSSLRRDGVVAAVVGIDHLDPLAARLGDGKTAS